MGKEKHKSAIKRKTKKKKRKKAKVKIPQKGDYIYVDSRSYLEHAIDDFNGGLCRIKEIKILVGAPIKRIKQLLNGLKDEEDEKSSIKNPQDFLESINDDEEIEIHYKIFGRPGTTSQEEIHRFWENQKLLKKKYGDERGYPIPDYDPYMNELYKFRTAKQLIEEALEIVEDALKDAPDFPPLLLKKGGCLLQLGCSLEAKKTLYKYLSIKGDESGSGLDALIFLSIAQINLAHYDIAEVLLKKALAKDPTDPRTLSLLGICYALQRKIELSESAFQALASLYPDSAHALRLMRHGLSSHEEGLLNDYLKPRVLATIYSSVFQMDYKDYDNIPEGKSLDEILEASLAATHAQYEPLVKSWCSQPFVAYQAHMCFTGHWQAATEILVWLRDFVKGATLDIGCGTGELGFLLCLLMEQELLSVDTVVGIDLNSHALEHAAKIIGALVLKKTNRPHFSFFESDISSKKWSAPKPHLFNTVMTSYVIHWLEKKLSQTIGNISNSLKKGGHFIVLSEYPMTITTSPFSQYASKLNRSHMLDSSKGVSLSRLKTLCKKNGLILIDHKTSRVHTPMPKEKHDMFGAVFKKI